VATTLFERLTRERPAPEPKTNQPHNDAQKMLDWLMRWPKPTISTSEMMIYGPRPKQNAEGVLKLAAILEKHGWLTPKTTPKKNMRHWDIVRRPFIHPPLDA